MISIQSPLIPPPNRSTHRLAQEVAGDERRVDVPVDVDDHAALLHLENLVPVLVCGWVYVCGRVVVMRSRP